MTVREGDTSAQFPVTTGKVETTEKAVRISASAGDVTKTATLTVQRSSLVGPRERSRR